MTCAFGLAFGLDLFQSHEHSVYLCSLPTESSPKSLPLGDFTFVQGGLTSSNFAKHTLIYSVSHFTLELCLWSKAPCGDGTGYQQPFISKAITKPCQVGHKSFGPLSSYYKVLRSTVIALNKFIQYRHWQVIQPFRLTPFLIRALITNHI